MGNKIRLEDILGLIYRRQDIIVERNKTLTEKARCLYRGECGDYKSEDGKQYYVTEIQLFPCELMILVTE